MKIFNNMVRYEGGIGIIIQTRIAWHHQDSDCHLQWHLVPSPRSVL